MVKNSTGTLTVGLTGREELIEQGVLTLTHVRLDMDELTHLAIRWEQIRSNTWSCYYGYRVMAELNIGAIPFITGAYVVVTLPDDAYEFLEEDQDARDVLAYVESVEAVRVKDLDDKFQQEWDLYHNILTSDLNPWTLRSTLRFEGYIDYRKEKV